MGEGNGRGRRRTGKWAWVGWTVFALILLVIAANLVSYVVVMRMHADYPIVQLGATDVRIVVQHDDLRDVTITINQRYSASLPALEVGTTAIDLSAITSPDGATLEHTPEIEEVHLIGRIGAQKVDTTITFGEGDGYSYSVQQIPLK